MNFLLYFAFILLISVVFQKGGNTFYNSLIGQAEVFERNLISLVNKRKGFVEQRGNVYLELKESEDRAKKCFALILYSYENAIDDLELTADTEVESKGIDPLELLSKLTFEAEKALFTYNTSESTPKEKKTV